MNTVLTAPKASKAFRKEASSKSKDTLRTRLMRRKQGSIHRLGEIQSVNDLQILLVNNLRLLLCL